MKTKEMQETIERVYDAACEQEEAALIEYGKHKQCDAARNEAADWQTIASLLKRLSAELSRKAGI